MLERIPFVTVVCWRNKYQSYIDMLLSDVSLPDDDEVLREVHPDLSTAKIYPGPQDPAKSRTNRSFALKPSKAYVNRARSHHLQDENINNNNSNNDDNNNNNNNNTLAKTISPSYHRSLSSFQSFSPYLCTVWPLYKDEASRDQQLFLLSDVVIVFVNSEYKEEMAKFMQVRILPLLVVATSRAGVEPETRPLKCFLIDESDSAAGDDLFEKMCDKFNTQQKKLNIFFATAPYKSVVFSSAVAEQRFSPIELIFDLMFDAHLKFLTEREKKNTHNKNDIDDEDGEVKQKHVDPNSSHHSPTTDTNNNNNNNNTSLHHQEAEDLRSFSVLGLLPIGWTSERRSAHIKSTVFNNNNNNDTDDSDNNKNKKVMVDSFYPASNGLGQEYPDNEEEKHLAEFSIIVQCHQDQAFRFYSSQHNNSNNDSHHDDITFIVTAARCPQECICEISYTEEVFKGSNILIMTLKPRSRLLQAAAKEVIGVIAANSTTKPPLRSQTEYERRFAGIFATGSVWGRCFTKRRNNNSNMGNDDDATANENINSTINNTTTKSNNDDDHAVNNSSLPSTSSTLASPFNFFTHFPATPQLVILRIPKLFSRFIRGVGGSVTLISFGSGETHLQATVVAIASPSEKRLMTTATPDQINTCVFYACWIENSSPLYIFERPWAKVLMTAAPGFNCTDAGVVVSACEVMYCWRKFEILKTMMRNLIFPNTSNNSTNGNDAPPSFESDFLNLKSHEEITSAIVKKIFAPAANNFLASESYALPLATSEDATAEESVMKYLFSFPAGLPGISPDIRHLGNCCIRAMMNDLFCDAHHLMDVDLKQFQSPPPPSKNNNNNNNRDNNNNTRKNNIINWLYTRKQNRAKETFQSGAVCLAHFLMILDNEIRHRWAEVNAGENDLPRFFDIISSININNSKKDVNFFLNEKAPTVLKNLRMNLYDTVYVSKAESITNKDADLVEIEMKRRISIITNLHREAESLGIKIKGANLLNLMRVNWGHFNNNDNNDTEDIDDDDEREMMMKSGWVTSFGNPASFINLFMIRLRLLPYGIAGIHATKFYHHQHSSLQPPFNPLTPPVSVTAGSSGDVYWYRQPRRFGETAQNRGTIPNSAFDANGGNPFCTDLFVGWHSSAPTNTSLLECWGLSLLCCAASRWQLEAALSQHPFTHSMTSKFANYPYQVIEQTLPFVFLANGMTGLMNSFLPNAQAHGDSPPRLHIFWRYTMMFSSIPMFTSGLERASAKTGFAFRLDHRHHGENGVMMTKRQARRIFALYDEAGLKLALTAEKVKSAASLVVSQLRDPKAQTDNPVLKEMQRHRANLLTVFGIPLTKIVSTDIPRPISLVSRKSTHTHPNAYYFFRPVSMNRTSTMNFSITLDSHLLTTMNEIIVYELMCDPRTKVSQIPIHFLFIIIKMASF